MNKDERERIKAERRAQIQDLNKEKALLVKMAAKLLKKPARRPKTISNRLAQAIVLLMRAQAVELKQYAIAALPLAKPLPDFKKGRNEILAERAAIVGEGGREVIVTSSGSFDIPKHDKLVDWPPADLKERWNIFRKSVNKRLPTFLEYKSDLIATWKNEGREIPDDDKIYEMWNDYVDPEEK